jgi:hypothetical protein
MVVYGRYYIQNKTPKSLKIQEDGNDGTVQAGIH